MRSFNTDKGITVQFGKDYDSMVEDTSDVFALSVVGGFVLFLLFLI